MLAVDKNLGYFKVNACKHTMDLLDTNLSQKLLLTIARLTKVTKKSTSIDNILRFPKVLFYHLLE